MNTFRFVGKIKKIEDKKDKKFIETISFEKSGWELTKIKFRLATDESSEFVEINGGKFKDDSKNTVYTQFIKEGAESKRETENAQVKWGERFNSSIVDKVPDFKKYTIDLSSDKIREALIKEGKNDEAAALASQKYSYISVYDFTKKFEELLTGGAFGDDNYVITGTIEYTYSVTKMAYYKSFVATNIYKAPTDESTGHFGKLDFYYNKDEVVGEANDNGDVPLGGHIQFYDRMSKKYYFAPTTLTLKNDNEKKDGLVKMFQKMGEDDAEILAIGLNVKFFSGSPKVDIKDEDLTDKQRELLEFGLKTKEEIIADMGGQAYGERANLIYVEKLSRGYANGPQKTDITAEQVEEVPTGEKADGKKATISQKKIDLFSDDDEI